MSCQLIGRWQIVKTNIWKHDCLDLIEPTMVVIQAGGHGFHVEYIRALVFFTWDGFDVMDEAHRSGSADLQNDGTLEIEFAYHLGDGATQSQTSLPQQPVSRNANVRDFNFWLGKHSLNEVNGVGANMIIYSNDSGDTVETFIDLGGQLSATVGDLADQIRDEAEGRPLLDVAFEYLVNRSQHDWSVTLHSFGVAPQIFLNSLGYGLCGDMTRMGVQVMKALGYQAYGASLAGAGSGHTTMVVVADGRNEVWDLDFRTTWLNDSGHVATLGELLEQPELITRGDNVLSTAREGATSPGLASVYEHASLTNGASQWGVGVNGYVAGWRLPPGAELVLGAGMVLVNAQKLPQYSESSQVQLQTAVMTLSSGSVARIQVPLLLYRIEGSGKVSLGIKEYEIGPDLNAALARLDTPWGVDARFYHVELVEARSTVEFVYLLNPLLELEVNSAGPVTGLNVHYLADPTSAADVIIGQDGPDELHGLSGNDRLEGLEGNDALSGNEGDDYLLGGRGDDTLLGGMGSDTLDDWEGQNDIRGGAGDDTFLHVSHGSGIDHLTGDLPQVPAGNSGRDTYVLGPWSGADAADFVSDFTTGPSGDLLDLTGLQLAFIEYIPSLNPFVGEYLRLVQNAADVLLQLDPDGARTAAGWSTVLVLEDARAIDFTQHNFAPGYSPTGTGVTIVGTSDADVLEGSINPETIKAANGDDTVTAGPGADTVHGGAGRDLLHGGSGDDYLAGDSDESADSPIAASDRLYGEEGDDRILGGAGPDGVWGGEGSDALSGGPGGDWLDGGLGNDVLAGGAGNDRLIGGGGDDRFVFEAASGLDVVVGFQPGRESGDILDFSRMPDVGEFSDLTITELGSDVQMFTQSGNVILVESVTLVLLSPEDFVF